MDQAINRVHGPRHFLTVWREPGLARQAEPFNVPAQNVRHVATANDEETGLGNLSVNAGGRLEKFALALPPWQTISARHGKNMMFGPHTPLLPLVPRLERAEARGINSAVDDLNF